MAAIVLVTALAGCGDEAAPAAGAGDGTRLVVEVRPRGESGPVQRRVVTEVPKSITPADFEPTPRDVACAEVYGGPARAHVKGTLDGRPIDATFDRTNACEMARWDAVAALIGKAPAATP